VSLTLGLVLAFTAKLHVLQLLGVTPAPDPHVDELVTGLIISGGTEGINSLLKFLKYTKEDKKNDAAAKRPADGNSPAGAPAATALTDMNKK
jgi:hypothetical protein